MKNNIELVYTTRNSHMYKGKLSNYQLEGNKLNNKKVTNYEQVSYNKYQKELYNRVLYGLSAFTKEELEMMHWEKKKRINKVHIRTKEILNIWKQEINNNIFEKFFKPMFTGDNREFAKDFVTLYDKETDPEIKVNVSFKTLGVSKEQIIAKLIEKGILAKDFYKLKPVHYGLPRFIKTS
jgi:hypothetical protein